MTVCRGHSIRLDATGQSVANRLYSHCSLGPVIPEDIHRQCCHSCFRRNCSKYDRSSVDLFVYKYFSFVRSAKTGPVAPGLLCSTFPRWSPASPTCKYYHASHAEEGPLQRYCKTVRSLLLLWIKSHIDDVFFACATISAFMAAFNLERDVQVEHIGTSRNHMHFGMWSMSMRNVVVWDAFCIQGSKF